MSGTPAQRDPSRCRLPKLLFFRVAVSSRLLLLGLLSSEAGADPFGRSIGPVPSWPQVELGMVMVPAVGACSGELPATTPEICSC